MNPPLLRQHAPRRARAERCEDILDAACKVFCERGYEATAVAAIAERIGVVEGTIYKYFPTKRALLLAVLEHWHGRVFGDAERDLVRQPSARRRLLWLISHHLDAIRREPQLCRLLFTEVRAKADYQGSALHALNRRYTRLLVDVVQAGIATGEFRADLPAVLLRDLIYGGIEHLAWKVLSGEAFIDVDRSAAQILSLVCDGLGPQPLHQRSTIRSLQA